MSAFAQATGSGVTPEPVARRPAAFHLPLQTTSMAADEAGTDFESAEPDRLGRPPSACIARRRPASADRRGVPWAACLEALQAALRRTSQTVMPIRSADRASSQPFSMNWNGQNRLAG